MSFSPWRLFVFFSKQLIYSDEMLLAIHKNWLNKEHEYIKESHLLVQILKD